MNKTYIGWLQKFYPFLDRQINNIIDITYDIIITQIISQSKVGMPHI